MSEFNVEQYVDKMLLKGKSKDELSLDEYDVYLDKKESIAKNIRNLLRRFVPSSNIKSFSFEEDALSYLPLRQFSSEDIGRFINHILNLKKEDTFVGNKLLYNLSKISVDRIDISVKGQRRSFEFLYMAEPKKSDLVGYIEECKCSNRQIIRRSPLDVKELMKNSLAILENLKKENKLSSLPDAIEFVNDLLLQALNYWVITIEGLSFKTKMHTVSTIDDYLEGLRNHVIEITKSKKFTLGIEDTVDIFTSFLIKRNDYGEYIKILNILEEEQNKEDILFGVPEKQYRVKKGDRVLQDKERNIITEGQKVDQYTIKLEKVKQVIDVFAKYGGRKACIEDILDLKVYFREIYISDSKYKRQAKAIVRKYLEAYQKKQELNYDKQEIVKSFEKESEYQFLREKISRGYFRETGDIRLYSVKNKLQKKLYEILMDILLVYDYEISLNLLQKIITELIPIYFNEIDNLLEVTSGRRIFLKKVP